MTMTTQNQLKYAGAILTAVYDFTPTELNHLFTSPVQVIPPPGPNQTILLLNVYAQLIFHTTAYTFNTAGFFFVGNQTDSISTTSIVADVLQASQSSVSFVAMQMTSIATATAQNKGIMYADGVADSSTSGDGTARMTIMYRVIGLV